jgi:nitrogen fixation/metabolism regulation signal transduction histidine kinase
MGLALITRIIKDHGGVLAFKKRDSGGTEATVTLPL